MPKAEQYVLMVHKDFTDRTPTKVLKTTFEKIWKDKGWQIAKEDKETASVSSPPTPSTTSASGGTKDT